MVTKYASIGHFIVHCHIWFCAGSSPMTLQGQAGVDTGWMDWSVLATSTKT